VFTPGLAKHPKSFSLVEAISVGVDRMQRNFEPGKSRDGDIPSKVEDSAEANARIGVRPNGIP